MIMLDLCDEVRLCLSLLESARRHVVVRNESRLNLVVI